MLLTYLSYTFFLYPGRVPFFRRSFVRWTPTLPPTLLPTYLPFILNRSEKSTHVCQIWRHRHQPDIWGLTKGMLQKLYFLFLKTISFLVQQNVGLVRGLNMPSCGGGRSVHTTTYNIVVGHDRWQRTLLMVASCAKFQLDQSLGKEKKR